MSDAYLQEIARYFAEQHPPYPAPQSFDLSSAARAPGQMLVNNGDPDKRIPACIACHSSAMNGVQPAAPGLLGLPRDYLVGQIGAWKSGARHALGPDCMALVAQRLSAEDIGAAGSCRCHSHCPQCGQAAAGLR